jgi:hypothetical protein
MLKWIGNRRITGAGLLLGGLVVLGLWTFLGGVVPILLMGIAVVLAWRRSAFGVGAAIVGAAILLWLGLTLGWIAWAVGIGLIGMGVLLVGWPRRQIEASDTAGRA